MEWEVQDWGPEQKNMIKENGEKISLFSQNFTNMGARITQSV
jgi:hypothetical protein